MQEPTNVSAADIQSRKDLSVGMVVAASTNNAIGKNNQLLWNLPNDMKFFKNVTWGFPVLMGRKTFEALGKPLAGRINIVISRQTDWNAEGVIIASNLEDAINKAVETNARQIFIIGGGEIFEQSMSIADTIYLTRVHAEFDADSFFPVIDENGWKLVSNTDFGTDGKHAYAYSFQVWKKQKVTAA